MNNSSKDTIVELITKNVDLLNNEYKDIYKEIYGDKLWYTDFYNNNNMFKDWLRKNHIYAISGEQILLDRDEQHQIMLADGYDKNYSALTLEIQIVLLEYIEKIIAKCSATK